MLPDILDALDGEGGTGTVAERVRALVAEVRRRRTSRGSRWSDAQITDALLASGGRYQGAARMLGCTTTLIRRRVLADPSIRPSGVPQFGRGRPRVNGGRAETIDSKRKARAEYINQNRRARAEEARQAVEAHGDMTKAARALGVSRQAIGARLAWLPKAVSDDARKETA